ncbi:MAG: hypothetical protein RL328_2323, partial [Acidobacteriota bacterium]
MRKNKKSAKSVVRRRVAPRPSSSVAKKVRAKSAKELPAKERPAQARRAVPPKGNRERRFSVVGIGASAGGLEAFSELLTALPPDTGMAFVLVQHLDPAHVSELTNILARKTSIPIAEVTEGTRVKPDRAYVIPPNTCMTIEGGVLHLAPRGEAVRDGLTIDAFLQSLANDQRERAIGIILSGSATDGTLGLEAIKAEGGFTFAQDSSAKYNSMPRSAIAAGCVDFVLRPADIAAQLADIAKHPLLTAEPEPIEDAATTAELDAIQGDVARPNGRQAFRAILSQLSNHSGVDFTRYKEATLQRRIARRMVLSKHRTAAAYARFLRGNAAELEALYADVLIGVTSFFRHPKAFDVLRDKLFPALLRQRAIKSLRGWVAGCSTGEEAYSIAMTYLEVAERVRGARRLKLFATDINEAVVERARQGLYPKTIVHEVSPERLQRFFTEESGGYRVNKALREMVVFARHNMIADPPFSQMDLVSCRNVLIYLTSDVQRRALAIFHYAMKPNGFLMVGPSDSLGGLPELFKPVDKAQRIYAKGSGHPVSPILRWTERDNPKAPRARKNAAPADASLPRDAAPREADRITINRFAPPAVLVDGGLQVV